MMMGINIHPTPAQFRLQTCLYYMFLESSMRSYQVVVINREARQWRAWHGVLFLQCATSISEYKMIASARTKGP